MNHLLLLLENDPDRLRELEGKIELPRHGKRVRVAKAVGRKAAKKADKRRSGSEARK